MRPLRLRSVLTLSAITIAGAAHAQGRALTIEDYYRVKNVGSPQISPDGRWVAYTVASRYEDNNADSSEVWVAPTDGSAAPRRLNPPRTHATNPGWDAAGRVTFSTGNCVWTADLGRPDPADAGCVTQQGASGGRRIA